MKIRYIDQPPLLVDREIHGVGVPVHFKVPSEPLTDEELDLIRSGLALDSDVPMRKSLVLRLMATIDRLQEELR